MEFVSPLEKEVRLRKIVILLFILCGCRETGTERDVPAAAGIIRRTIRAIYEKSIHS